MIQLAEKGPPERPPDVGRFPFGQAAPTGHAAGEALREIPPAGAGAQDPEDAFEARAILRPGPPAFRGGLGLRQAGRNPRPLSVRQQRSHRLPIGQV
jgi:hypothetical protein